ncbi:MAG: putative transcription regulator [Jatrophihabitans sp.]|nr:putative transcription regulator [Jatrophihabitans sp.]
MTPSPSADLTVSTPRILRADARRNHDLLLETAGALFAQKGIDVSLEEIARTADVGIGTLYRHFPSRDALNEAVYRREVELLCDGVDELIATNSADDALAAWMGAFATYVARKRGMAVALKSALGADAELFSSSRRRMIAALDQLLANAVSAGLIREDVDSEDLLSAMSGICMASPDAAFADRTRRLVDLLIDGLRYRAASR